MRFLLVRWRAALLGLAATLMLLAIVLPLWGMTLVSTQYPEGLHMVVYPSRITGEIREINALNHYIGMTAISDQFFVELRLLPLAFGTVAGLVLLTLALRRRWATLLPLAALGMVALYGGWSMYHRLYQFGHDLDPTAPITIAPFMPPVVGLNQIAQFATYSYFSWGTFLPALAAVLLVLVWWADGTGSAVRPALTGSLRQPVALP